MPTTQTNLFAPPLRGSELPTTIQKWLLTLQLLLPLNLVDTSAGSYAEALPSAGLSASTGQPNQGQELVYKKTSADGNTFTLTGALEGSQTLTAQWSKVRLKSNGTNWYVVG